MEIKIVKASLQEIQLLRELFLNEGNFQFVCNKCHQYGWAGTWLFLRDGTKIGYGSVWGKDKREDRDTIFEFYLLPPYRKDASFIFREFQVACGASYVESQSNDALLTLMLYEFCQGIFAEAILFKDDVTTNFNVAGIAFRKQAPEDETEGAGQYVLELNNEIVATGGFVWNYNLPYIDMFYEVKENFRRKGYGSLMTQELKKEAYLMSRVPAARCNPDNTASKLTLLKAGMQICGFRLTGNLKENNLHTGTNQSSLCIPALLRT
ncbi:MAG: GNAT family N-acetyltransferase [Bacteroidota bacterium]